MFEKIGDANIDATLQKLAKLSAQNTCAKIHASY